MSATTYTLNIFQRNKIPQCVVRDFQLQRPRRVLTSTLFSSRCTEPASGGGGHLPRRAADEEVQTESGVRSSALLRLLLHGLPPPAAPVRHQVR